MKLRFHTSFVPKSVAQMGRSLRHMQSSKVSFHASSVPRRHDTDAHHACGKVQHMDILSFLRYGFFGRDAFRWVNGDDGDWRRLAFLIGSVVLIIVLFIFWKAASLFSIALMLAYTVLFGYKMAAAVLIVTAGLIIIGAFLSLFGGNTAAARKPEEKEETWLDLWAAARDIKDSLDSTARKRLSASEYNSFCRAFDNVSTRGELDNAKYYWEHILNARWDGYSKNV